MALLDTLNALTTATPTAAELRIRADFWTKYARGITQTNLAEMTQYDLVMANISDMRAKADAMDHEDNQREIQTELSLMASIATLAAPAAPVPAELAHIEVVHIPTVTVTEPAPMPPPAPQRRKRTVATTLSAAAFWLLCNQAVASIRAVHGERWHLSAETVWGTIPAKWASIITERGHKIRWSRDQRLPAACYWPDKTIPEGVDVSVTMPLDYDAAMLRSAREHVGNLHIQEMIRTGAVSKRRIVRERIRLRAKARTAHATDWLASIEIHSTPVDSHDMATDETQRVTDDTQHARMEQSRLDAAALDARREEARLKYEASQAAREAQAAREREEARQAMSWAEAKELKAQREAQERNRQEALRAYVAESPRIIVKNVTRVTVRQGAKFTQKQGKVAQKPMNGAASALAAFRDQISL